MRPTHLVADILDKQIVDAKKLKCGKADGLVLVVRKDKPPRIAAIEIGSAVVARRIGKWLTHLVRKDDCFRVPWSKVKEVDIDVMLDFDASEAPPLAWERWLRDRVVGKVPLRR